MSTDEIQLAAGKLSLKEMSTLFDQMKRENYELKLRLFQLEERESTLLRHAPPELKAALAENVELKIRLDHTSQELNERNELLIKTRAHLNSVQRELDDLRAESIDALHSRSLSASTSHSHPPAPILAQQLAEARQELAQLRGQLDAKQVAAPAANGGLRKLVQEQAERISTLSYELECRVSDCALAQQQLAAKSELLAESIAAMETLERVSADCSARATASQSHVAELQARLAALKQDVRDEVQQRRQAADDALSRAVLSLVNLCAHSARGAAPITSLTLLTENATAAASSSNGEDGVSGHERLWLRALRVCESDVERLAETSRNEGAVVLRAQQLAAEATRRADERVREATAEAARRAESAVQEATRRNEDAARHQEVLLAQANERVRLAEVRAREALERDDARVVRLQQQMTDLKKLKDKENAVGGDSNAKSGAAVAVSAVVDGDVDVEERLTNALQRVERLAANNRVLILELEEARKVTTQMARAQLQQQRQQQQNS